MLMSALTKHVPVERAIQNPKSAQRNALSTQRQDV